ncbi:MAG: methyltransferase domain-containing protein [Acidobacteria bacterium]|nr:methyltransferase domain-containing protein [Acidobacteriota bacterium]
MDPRLQRRVQRYGWDKASGEYEKFWRRQLEPAQRTLLSLVALAPGMRVLDIACGTGLVTFPAAHAVGPTGRVVGTDISQEMVTRSTGDARSRGVSNVTFERMDAENLQCDAASFDVALCALGLMYVPDPLKALSEMRRVLRPGGRAVAAVWGARSRCGWAEIFPIVDRRVASEVCPMFFQLGTGDMLQHQMRAAGFSSVHVERIATTLDYASADEAVGAAFVGGPVALAYSHFDDRVREEAHVEYLASIDQYKRGDGYAVPGEFVIARGEA